MGPCPTRRVVLGDNIRAGGAFAPPDAEEACMRRFTTASLALTIAADRRPGRRAGGRGAGRFSPQDRPRDRRRARSTTATSTSTRGRAPRLAPRPSALPAPAVVISQQSADIGNNIQAFVDQDYDVIVTIGFAAGADTLAAAMANPDIKFIGVDQAASASTRRAPRTARSACAGDAIRPRCPTTRASTGASSSPATSPASWPPRSARPATSGPSAARPSSRPSSTTSRATPTAPSPSTRTSR